jgi:hypothetical protein
LDLSPLRSEPFRLEQINDALAALDERRVARPLVDVRESRPC